MARQPSEYARVEVLLEEVRSEFRTVAEGYQVLDRKIDSVRSDLSQRIGVLEQAVSMGFHDVRADIRRLEGRMDGFDGWVRSHDHLHTASRS